MTEAWEIVDHVCGGCAGRLVRRREGSVRDAPPAVRHWLYRCTNCGMQGIGETKGHPLICGCNYRLGDPKTPGRPAGVRCTVNPRPTPECPAEIVVMEV